MQRAGSNSGSVNVRNQVADRNLEVKSVLAFTGKETHKSKVSY